MNDERGLMKGKGGLGALWNLRRAFPYFVVGYGYASRAMALERGARPGPGTSELKGRPGTRAPHVWLSRDGKRVSTLDLFGKGFVLLAGPDGRQWAEAARAVAQRLGLRLEVLRLGGRLDDPERRWPRAFGVRSDGAVLVRPDGFVAWRATQIPAHPEETLTRIFEGLLARAPDVTAPAITLGRIRPRPSLGDVVRRSGLRPRLPLAAFQKRSRSLRPPEVETSGGCCELGRGATPRASRLGPARWRGTSPARPRAAGWRS